VERLQPRVVMAHEVHTHGVAAMFCRNTTRVLMPWGSDIFTAVETSSIMFRLVRRALQQADLILPASTVAAEYIISRFHINPAKVRGISWGIKLNLFRQPTAIKKQEFRAALGLPKESILVTNARRFQPMWNSEAVLKGFIKCAGADSRLHFVLISGLLAEQHIAETKEALRQQGCLARFTIFDDVPIEKYRDILAASDIFTSLSPRFDMRSSSILQGAACGAIPIISEAEEFRRIERNGFRARFVPAADAEVLAEAILSVSQSLASMQEWVEENQRYLLVHEDKDKQHDKILEHIREAVKRRQQKCAGSPA
jgi:glycosyltransferase involved in cell wall biosynthesis